MSRRGLTLLLASALALVLAVLGAVTTVPYVALLPGPAYDTLSAVGGSTVITVTGAKTYPTDGRLDLTTVGVRDDLTLVEALRGWLSDSQEVVPHEVIFPPDQTAAQNEQQNVQEMKDSQDSATAAALGKLGLAKTAVVVTSTTKGSPADGKLRADDVITTVDGTTVASTARLRALIGARAIGAPVTVGFLRGGAAQTVTLTTVTSPDTPARPFVGLATSERSDSAVTVTISLQAVGGPSAGLMFALGILDKLGPESLTGGRNIAGTGTIDAAGVVGPIGGISEKLLGARAVGATVFLVPVDNCAEAASHRPAGLQLVKVDSLDTALAGLAALRAGGTPPSC